MTDSPYLLAIIAHGKPVFEIGYQLECPLCKGDGNNSWDEGCPECDGLGHWWITNTGWRARPYWSAELDVDATQYNGTYVSIKDRDYDGWVIAPYPPDDHPDHFQSYIDRGPRSAEPSSLLASLGLGKPKAPIQRRNLK